MTHTETQTGGTLRFSTLEGDYIIRRSEKSMFLMEVWRRGGTYITSFNYYGRPHWVGELRQEALHALEEQQSLMDCA